MQMANNDTCDRYYACVAHVMLVGRPNELLKCTQSRVHTTHTHPPTSTIYTNTDGQDEMMMCKQPLTVNITNSGNTYVSKVGTATVIVVLKKSR